jgi:hypothetical protein
MKAINLAYAMLLDRPRVAAPLEIVSDALPPARAGGPYRVALAASGGVEPYTWEAVLPRGLVLDGDGVLSGRVERTLAFTLRVTDRDGRLVERGLVVHIEPVPQQADPVAVDAPGSDVQPAASREPIAVPGRRSVDPAAVATGIVLAGAAAVLLPWLISLVVVAALALLLGAARRTRRRLDRH